MATPLLHKNHNNKSAAVGDVSYHGGRMDITWAAIGKILLAGFASYILLPAALILRDQVLWKVITTYILNDKLRNEIRTYARLADHWNKNFAGKKNFDGDAFEGFAKHVESSQKAQDELNKSKLYIDRKSRLLSLLLKHYKHEAINPIGEWKKQAHKEIEKHNNES
jgi:hypothetical protein